MNICENIIGSRLFPAHDAIVAGEQRLTYSDVECLSARAAHVLRSMGIERQDRVGIVIPNVPAFVIWYYACLRLGAIAVSISARLSGEEVAFILSDCDAKVVVGTKGLAELLNGELPDCIEQVMQVSEDALLVDDQPLEAGESIGASSYEDLEPDDPATILYTSGTTGFPKGATLSHKNVRATMHAFNHLCGMQPVDRMLLAVPLFHCYGQNALLNSALNVGATLVLQRLFDLAESRQLIIDHQITMLFGVPTTFQLMLESCSPADLSSIRYCFSAAAKLPEQLSYAWREKFGQPIYEGYGLTETAPFASYNHRLKFVPGSIGWPVDLVEMKIVDTDTGATCPPGTPGEIAIRGPNVMLGYWNRPRETAEVMRDGWFHSGDIGRVDENGFFYIVDRLKDMIVVGGMKVFPAQVERVLLDHPAVAEAAVVGFPDEVLGERVIAFAVAVAGSAASQEEIRSHCRDHLGSYKVPRRVIFVDSLPRNPAGKILKTKLRQFTLPVIDGDADTATATSQRAVVPTIGTPLVDQLRATHRASRSRFLASFIQDELRALTGHDEALAADGLLSEAEMDSLMIVEFRDRLQMHVGSNIELPATLVFDHPRISDLVDFLLTSLATDVSEDSAPRPIEVGNPATAVTASVNTPVENMSEQQAMEALLREVNE